MGIYLNPNNTKFYNAVKKSKIYVDKTELINFTNQVIFGEQKYVCVSRPRRFGKSTAANMLTAYYNKKSDSSELFDSLLISKSEDYKKHLNKYDVIRIDIQKLFSHCGNVHDMIELMQMRITKELSQTFDMELDETDLPYSLEQLYDETSTPFIFIIDEWDHVLRVSNTSRSDQKQYLDFLCSLFKDQNYVALAYMTGILPIKKYGVHSALNMFYEYSMTNAEPIEQFTGFTEQEVKELCEKYTMDFNETKRWYDGYCLNGISIYNPNSVVEAITRKRFDSYWTKTETYEAIKIYINMNFDGLRDSVMRLIAGERIVVDTTTFTNDMVTFEVQDDVLTLLIHLGYLAYDFDTKEVYIPNYEIREQFISTVRVIGWTDVIKSLQLSEKLLNATLSSDHEKIAEIIRQVHFENTSILKYNDENSLSCVLSLAYYSAKKNYVMYREMQGGEGFADMVFIPRKNCSTSAFIVELKWDKSAETAIDQIKQRKYFECLKDYSGEILLVGVNYDKDTKEHTCLIEKITK